MASSAFCRYNADGSECHRDMVYDSLSFIRPLLLDRIAEQMNSPDDNEYLSYDSGEHFDRCNFEGGVDIINRHYYDSRYSPFPFSNPPYVYPGAINYLAPLEVRPRAFDAMSEFGKGLQSCPVPLRCVLMRGHS